MSRLAKEILIVGFNDTTNRSMIRYHFDCDTVSDLPTLAEGIAQNVDIAMTSTAHVIETDEDYEMKSDGTWVKQKGEFELSLDAAAIDYDNTDSGMTADNVQDAIDEIKELDDMQGRALAELTVENANQQLEIDYAVNTGVKNLLEVTSQTQTINGVTFTVNADQTITVNGTNTGSATALFTINDLEIPAGEPYTLTGCPAGGSNSTFYLGSLDTTNWQEYIADIGNGGTKTLQTPMTIRFRIGVRSGVTVNNLVFKPMLRPASITDSTFQPYALPNPVLTPAVIKAVDEGAKNLFDIATPDTTRNTVVTPITDGGATISCSNKAWTQYAKSVSVTVGKQYTFSAKIESLTGTASGKFKIFIRDGSSSGSNLAELTINENGNYNATITPTQNTVSVCIYINNDSTARTASANVYGMICTAQDWAVSQKFVPYRPSWQEMWEMILQLQSAANS